MNNRGQNLDLWDKVVENAVNTKAKAYLQLFFGTKKIDFRYSKKYRPLIKKNKDDIYWEHCNETSNKDKDKAKSHNSFSANQSQNQTPKKDMHSCWSSHLVTRVNTIEVAKKDKDKAKDLSYIKCYTYKQNNYYANKCPKKSKNKWRS